MINETIILGTKELDKILAIVCLFPLHLVSVGPLPTNTRFIVEDNH